MYAKLVLAGALLACVASLSVAQSSSDNYVLEKSVIGSAGGPCKSTGFKLNSTLGQSTPIGEISAPGIVLGAGFWYDKIVLDGDATGDCKVNILDLIYIRNHLQQDPSSSPEAAAADVNKDGRINVLDLIYARNRLGTKCEAP
jgi:hypothetical protein